MAYYTLFRVDVDGEQISLLWEVNVTFIFLFSGIMTVIVWATHKNSKYCKLTLVLLVLIIS